MTFGEYYSKVEDEEVRLFLESLEYAMLNESTNLPCKLIRILIEHRLNFDGASEVTFWIKNSLRNMREDFEKANGGLKCKKYLSVKSRRRLNRLIYQYKGGHHWTGFSAREYYESQKYYTKGGVTCTLAR